MSNTVKCDQPLGRTVKCDQPQFRTVKCNQSHSAHTTDNVSRAKTQRGNANLLPYGHM